MNLAIRVTKNYSFNTILAGAMLDPLAEHPAPYYFGHRAWQIQEARRRKIRTRLVAAWQSLRSAEGHPRIGNADVPVRNGSADVPVRNGSADVLVRNVQYVRAQAKATIHTARLILAILNVLEHRNPAAWAANQRQAYLSVLRWCVANYGPIPKNSTAAAIAQKCYYRLGLFHRWEAVEKSRGILTSRQIEKGLRWDGWQALAPYKDFQGFEFRLIRDMRKGWHTTWHSAN